MPSAMDRGEARPLLSDLDADELMERVESAFATRTTAEAIELLLDSHVLAIGKASDYSDALNALLVAEAEMIRIIICRLDEEAWRDGFALYEEHVDA